MPTCTPERFGTSGPLDGPSTTTWRRQRLLRIGSISSVQNQAVESEQASPIAHRVQTVDESSVLRPTNEPSYGAVNSLLHRWSDVNLAGTRLFSASGPPSPVLASSYLRNISERPISAYDAALALQSNGLNKETESDAQINGIRVWYSSFSSIDWLHDAIKDSVRFSRLRKRKSVRARIRLIVDKSIGWWIVTLVGFLAAVVAFLIVRSEQWLFDSKEGYCRDNWWKAKRFCCPVQAESQALHLNTEDCTAWRTWGQVFGLAKQEGGWLGFEQEVIEYIAYAIVAVCRLVLCRLCPLLTASYIS
jgi:chloride channel 3/4/5